MRAGDDIRWDDRATARGCTPWTRFHSSRSQSGTRAGHDIRRDDWERHEAGRRGRGSPPLTPSQGREQETTSAGMTGATAQGRASWTRFPSSRFQSGTRAGYDDCGTSRKWAANQKRGQPSQRNALGRVDPQAGPS